MGRKKTKYTKADACIYIMYCIMKNEFNTLDSLSDCLDISNRQVRRYISEINLTMYDFMLEVKVVCDKNTGRFVIR